MKKTEARFVFVCFLAFLAIYATPVRSASIPSEILSPVVGDLEVVSSLEQCLDTKWCFNQHQSGGHVPGGGIGQADDTYAWDVNLNTPTFDSDKGKPIYVVAGGVIPQTYGGSINAGGSYGQLLVEHNFQGNTWWSGYLHLRDIQVRPGQSVDKNTLLGYISNTSPDSIPNHLHFVVYKGQNTPGGLVSFDANIVPIPTGRVTLNLDTKYWEYGSYQLRVIVQASPGEVSSITISGPCIDAVTYSYSGGQRCFILDTKEPPRIGQTITFYIEYQDNSSETISKTIDGVFTETPVLVSPPDDSTVNTLTPTFEWRNLSISGLIYSVQIDDINHTTRVYSVYDLPDGTTSHTIPGGYVDRGTTYYWLVAATDANGNEALADWDKLRISSVAGLGYHKVTQVIDTINQGAETVFNYIISQTKDLIFGLGWEGSTLKLSVYRPDGSLHAEEENSTSPITITISKAEAGEWRYKITGIDVPYDDYPFVVEIGQRPPVASDLQNLIAYPNPCRLTDGNPTITFKGLTADATIRILGIDGQLINQTELIGQVNWTWNVKNQANEDLTRGIYIYLITNSSGQKKIGKIAIIK